MANTVDSAFSVLNKYVKRISYNKTFSANDVRDKLVKNNISSSYLPVILTKAVKSNLIEKVDVTPSTLPSSKGRQVGVYMRGI